MAEGDAPTVIVRRQVLLLALLCAVAGAAACTSSSKDDPKASPSSTAATSSIVSSAPSTGPSAPGTSGSASSEAAKRQAVEAAWTKFWGVYTKLHTIPANQLDGLVDAVSVDPTRKGMLAEVKAFASLHRTNYGFVITHPHWQQPIDNKNTAVMGDCQDQSHFGAKSTTTGAKLTVGIARDNLKATLVRGGDGIWRVELIEYLKDVKC